MKDEIKEILDYLKDENWSYYPCDGIPYKVFLMEERDKLLDYITNLQQENQKNKKIIKDVYDYLDEKKRCARMVGHRFFYMYEYAK